MNLYRERRNEIQRQAFQLEQETVRLVETEKKKQQELDRQAVLDAEFELTGGVTYEKELRPCYVEPQDIYEETNDKVIVSQIRLVQIRLDEGGA